MIILTSYELDFLSNFASIVKFEGPKVWSRSVVKEDFHHGTHNLFSFSYHKTALFETKYEIKLITLMSMYHLKPLVSLDFIKK